MSRKGSHIALIFVDNMRIEGTYLSHIVEDDEVSIEVEVEGTELDGKTEKFNINEISAVFYG